MVERQVASGRFRDAEHVVLAAVASLETELSIEDEIVASIGTAEVARLIEEGERSGMRDGGPALAELRAWREAESAKRLAVRP